MGWFTYWHVVAVLALLVVVFVYLAYRAEVYAEDVGRAGWWETGGVPVGCLPMVAAALCALAALCMLLWKFIWWLL
ncbi:MAG: hypothetical protein ISS15_05290 [Alphaproteobacteria bacterium]|nr:hypothetical protein [Alphaproteobacteria bacterium]MBL6939466.1 hypothetical protein [Alphaproteobacteria bacterium]MBL7097053.1 hypothetical protein [Alphaproteobacteria bacterium]